MGMTIAEKILAGHSRRAEVHPGDVVVVDIDVIVDLDIAFGITGGHPMPTRVCDPEKIVLVARSRLVTVGGRGTSPTCENEPVSC